MCVSCVHEHLWKALAIEWSIVTSFLQAQDRRKCHLVVTGFSNGSWQQENAVFEVV